MRLNGLHECLLAPVILIPPQLAVLEVVKVDGRVPGLYQSPDTPVLVRHKREKIPLCNCSGHLLLTLHSARLSVWLGAMQQEAMFQVACTEPSPSHPDMPVAHKAPGEGVH